MTVPFCYPSWSQLQKRSISNAWTEIWSKKSRVCWAQIFKLTITWAQCCPISHVDRLNIWKWFAYIFLRPSHLCEIVFFIERNLLFKLNNIWDAKFVHKSSVRIINPWNRIDLHKILSAKLKMIFLLISHSTEFLISKRTWFTAVHKFSDVDFKTW